MHELRVRQAVQPCRRVDARDPQAAEVALAVAAIAIAVLVGLEQGFFGRAVTTGRVTAHPLRHRQGLTALLARVDGTLYAAHDFFAPSRVLTRGASWSDRITGAARLRLYFGDFFSSMWLEKAWRAFTFPFAVTLNRFLAPEWVFIFGIVGGMSKADWLRLDLAGQARCATG